MQHKISSLLISIASLVYSANANEGFQKGFYAGASLGGSSFKGKRSDRHVSNDGPITQLSKNASINDTSERAEAFLGYFFPFFQDKIGISAEGFFAFSALKDRVRRIVIPEPDVKFYFSETLKTKRSVGGNLRLGPIINKRHFIGVILGAESTRFTRNHVDGFGAEYHKVSRQKTGFQYGLTYQFGWKNSSIGIDLKQTRFASIRMSKADSTNAVTTTRFKPNINSFVVRYSYRFY